MIVNITALIYHSKDSLLIAPITVTLFCISIRILNMNYLHAAVIEDFEECFISASEEGLHTQVNTFLSTNSIIPPTDAEWAVCILAKSEDDIPIDNLGAVGLITYYKVDSRSEKNQIIAKLTAMK